MTINYATRIDYSMIRLSYITREIVTRMQDEYTE